MNVVRLVDNCVKINCLLISVFDKTGLPELASGLLDINPSIRIYSSGGTFDGSILDK